MTSNPMIPQSYDDAISLLGEIRATTNTLTKLQLERDHRVKAIDDQFSPRLEEAQAQIKTMTEILEGWSKAHPEAFDGSKSITCLHGSFGYRTSPPALKPLWPLKWDNVLHNLKQLGHGATEFIA